MMAEALHYKIPESVLVIVHTPALQVLLLRRVSPGGEFWQSVTGSRKALQEPLARTACREVREETGLDCRQPGNSLSNWHLQNRFEIMPQWGARYAPGVTHNLEHVFGLCVPQALPVRLNPREHTDYAWVPWEQALQRCFSWANRDALRELARRTGARA